MTELKQFKLPDVGEGLTEADIVKWHVQPGDRVSVNQTIVDIETAKAMVELPCPFDGVVAGLLVAEGQTVDVGTPIISVDVSGGTTDALAEDLVPSPPAEGAVEPGVHGTPPPKPERQPVLVGYGVKLGRTARRPRWLNHPLGCAGRRRHLERGGPGRGCAENPPAGRGGCARGTHPRPRGAQAYGGGGRRERIHGAPCHRVPPGRCDRDDGRCAAGP